MVAFVVVARCSLPIVLLAGFEVVVVVDVVDVVVVVVVDVVVVEEEVGKEAVEAVASVDPPPSHSLR